MTIRCGSTMLIRSRSAGQRWRRQDTVADPAHRLDPGHGGGALAIGSGACQSTTRSRRIAGENRSTVSVVVMTAPFI